VSGTTTTIGPVATADAHARAEVLLGEAQLGGVTEIAGTPADQTQGEVQPGEAQDAPAQVPPQVAATPLPALTALDEQGLDVVFRTARTHWNWTDRPVTDDELRRVYDLLRLGPTSANCSPARFLFLRTQESRDKLRPALSAGNVDKVMAAPVTVIVSYDPAFYDQLPKLYPETDAKSWFADNKELAKDTAFRNGTLQGAYLIMAARAVGLDAGPMSGFDNARVDQDFMSWRGWKSNFLVSLGHGEAEKLPPRAPRLEFWEACELL